jgi:outer membrane receptor protein involved in Fe transport
MLGWSFNLKRMKYQHRLLLRLAGIMTMGAMLAVPGRAQTTPTTTDTTMTMTTTTTTTTSSTDTTGPVTTLAKMTVSDVPLDEQVLPTVRPISDVMGDDTSILDTPRSVSSINEAWMKDRMVKNAMDFGQFAPGVYSEAQYGIPAVPFIRGDLSQMYIDGQIIPFTRNSVPPSFNGVESIDIVKGPGSAVYGPQGEGAGGYVDFVTKEPYFDRFHADTDVTLGYWTSGHSYSNPEATMDFGGPLSDKLAYRISYLSRYGDGYYLNDHDQTQDLYAALTYRATGALKFEWWAQGYGDRTNEITGVNRVTQQFIENGTYIGGPATPVTSGPNAFFGYDITTPVKPTGPFTGFGSFADGSYSVVNPATAYTVKLPAYDALIGPGDTARSKLFQTQLKTTLQLTPDSSLVNRSYFGLGSSDKFETYGYDEYVPRQESAQDRLELHELFATGPVTNSVITGGDFRYQELLSYQDFTTEPFSYYDLYQPLSKVFYPGYYLEGETFGGGVQVPGAPGFSANASSPSTGSSSGNQYSHIYDTAAFIQDTIKVGQFSLIPGYRIDNIAGDTENPAVIQTAVESDFTVFPLTTPVYIPAGHSSPIVVTDFAGTHPSYVGYKVADTKVDQSYFTSLVYKPTESTSLYLTYDHVDAVLGSANFGGLNVSGEDANLKTAIDNSLTTTSTLYEGGFKQSLLQNTLYFSAVVFQQIKLGNEITGQTYPIKDNGIELDSVYQPNKSWTFNANATFQAATAYGTGFYQQTGNYLDNFSTTTVVDGQHGTGVGGPNFTTYSPPNGRMRTPGVPQAQANFFVVYKHPSGFGVGMGPQIIGRQYANDQDTLHIPGEYELDGYVFYGQKTWDVRVNVTNITNARILDPIDVTFAGNDTIFVRKPISASITFRYHF